MSKERYNQIMDEAYKNYKRHTHNKNELNGNKGGHSKWGDNPLIAGVQHLTKDSFIQMIKVESDFSKTWGLKIEERELSLDEKLPKKIKLKGYADEMEFSLTDKREMKFYGRTKESNESLERVEKLKDNEVFYQTDFGWGVFLNTDTFETISYDGTEWGGQKINIPTKQITLTYQNEKIEVYE